MERRTALRSPLDVPLRLSWSSPNDSNQTISSGIALNYSGTGLCIGEFQGEIPAGTLVNTEVLDNRIPELRIGCKVVWSSPKAKSVGLEFLDKLFKDVVLEKSLKRMQPCFIDLGATIGETAELLPVKIKRVGFKHGAFLLGMAALLSESSVWKSVRQAFKQILNRGFTASDFPDQAGLSWEEVTLGTHVGTHMDAPYHFGPLVEGKPARTVEQIPLEWCYGNGVALDLTLKKPGEPIMKTDIQQALDRIGYTLREGDIVLLNTGASKLSGEKKYLGAHPGMSQEALFWILEQGIKIVGTDGWGFDKPFTEMLKEYFDTHDKNVLWPAHLAGRIKEYCHIEKLANLENIPRPFGFKVACFPIKIKNASAGWLRPVAILDHPTQKFS